MKLKSLFSFLLTLHRNQRLSPICCVKLQVFMTTYCNTSSMTFYTHCLSRQKELANWKVKPEPGMADINDETYVALTE
jgi:hypothetical protein